MKIFEYKIEVSYGGSLNEAQLNKLGNEGWELTNIIIVHQGMVTKPKIDYIFRRKL